MKNRDGFCVSLARVELIVFIVTCLLAVAGCSSNKPNGTPATTEPAKPSSSPALNFQKQHEQAEEQFRPGIDAERQKDQKDAEQALDQDAITAVEQTEGALRSIAENNKADAMASIERATGKINILLAKDPASALIPVYAEVVIIDAAPTDVKAVDQIVQQATNATKRRNLPEARLLLASVVSELRIRTTSLPLGTYPAALQESARLLDQGKNQDAGDVLLTAINTLVTVDHVIPIPLLLAQSAIDAANSQRQNKETALVLLQTARNESNLSRHLGYLNDDSEYKALDQEIANLEKVIKGPSDTSLLFAQLRDKISAFIKRQKEHEHR